MAKFFLEYSIIFKTLKNWQVDTLKQIILSLKQVYYIFTFLTLMQETVSIIFSLKPLSIKKYIYTDVHLLQASI